MKIEHLISISGSILMVYSTNNRDYYYEIIFWDKTLYQPNELYQTARQAKVIGLSMIKVVIGY